MPMSVRVSVERAVGEVHEGALIDGDDQAKFAVVPARAKNANLPGLPHQFAHRQERATTSPGRSTTSMLICAGLPRTSGTTAVRLRSGLVVLAPGCATKLSCVASRHL